MRLRLGDEWVHKRARIGGTVLTAYALTLLLIIKADHNKILLAN